MSNAMQAFQYSIKDAEELLEHFDALNSSTPPPNAEILKRAGLVMALTAWETYIEDRVNEALRIQLRLIAGSHCGDFIQKKLEGELKRFHNPDASKTKQLFLDYLGVDVTLGWDSINADATTNKKALDGWISKRGQAVHRSKVNPSGPPAAHLVRRDDLDKAIRFLKMLVERTDQYLEQQM